MLLIFFGAVTESTVWREVTADLGKMMLGGNAIEEGKEEKISWGRGRKEEEVLLERFRIAHLPFLELVLLGEENFSWGIWSFFVLGCGIHWVC
jgi:hypothetical protein